MSGGETSAGVSEESQPVETPGGFDSFQYWREPVPTLDLESILREVSEVEPASLSNQGQAGDGASLATLSSNLQSGLSLTNSSNSEQRTFVFGPDSQPSVTLSVLDMSGICAPTYASILASGGMRDHIRTQSTGSSGGESYGVLSELMAKQQVGSLLQLYNPCTSGLVCH